MPIAIDNKCNMRQQKIDSFHIAVIETSLQIAGHICTVFHIVLETNTHHFSLIRFIQDFKELDTLLSRHFPTYRIALPNIHHFYPQQISFFHTLTKRKKKKTNSELLEAYLYQCLKGTIGRSSLFRDFLSIQRDEDRIISKSAVRQLVSQQHHHVSQSSSIHHEKRILCESLPPSPPSSISITQFPDYQEDCPDRQHEIIPKKSKSIQDYQFINVLGKGATGKVILVKEKSSNDNQLFALKAITKSWNITKREVNHIRMERNILATISSLHHPFLIQLHSAFQDQHSLYLVLAYHAGADLATLLQRYICFPPEQCRLYAAEIVMGLQELHRNFILYRDLKPENVLLAADGHIVLTDFGLSKMFNDNNHFDHRTTTFCGTPEYLAPEVILQEEEYSYAADLWSLGIMLYEMISGIIPFAASTPADMYERVLYDDLVFPEHCFARDPEVVDLISGLLEKDPLNRLGAGLGGVFELRNHAYFINHLNWRDVYRKRTQPIYVPYRLCETDLSHFDTDFLNMSTSVFDKEEDIQLHSGLYPAGLSEDAFRGYSYYHDDDNNNSQSCNDNGSESFFFDKDEDYSDYQYFNSSSMSDLDEEEEEDDDDIIDVPTSKLSYYYSPTIICNKTLKRKRSMIMDSSSFSYL